MELDYEQYKLVREALHERRIFLQTAPYLSAMLPIMLPIYKYVSTLPRSPFADMFCRYWQVPYYWVGCKMYDILAGKENMESSYLMSKGKALEAFPMLKQDGLVGALVYYDGLYFIPPMQVNILAKTNLGQHNDSRMNMALIMTAVQHGATVLNYTEVSELHKNVDTKICGARVQDKLTGETFDVRAKVCLPFYSPFALL